MKIPITFLGTGQAIPTAKRNHTAILLKYKAENILIDCGEGTQRQFRKAKLNPCKLTRMLITHWHGDHVLGIAGLLQTLLLNGYNKTLYIYGPKGTNYFMKQLIKLFVPYNKIPLVIKEISKGQFLETSDFILEAQPMTHGIPCNAYAFTEKEKLRLDKSKIKKLDIEDKRLFSQLSKGKNIKVKGKTIKSSSVTYKQPERKVSIIFDTKLNPNCYKIAKGSEVLLTEAVYVNQDKDLASLHEHLTAEQAGEIAKKAKVKSLYLVHLSQRYDGNEKVILNEVKKKFKNSVVADDLMQIEI